MSIILKAIESVQRKERVGSGEQKANAIDELVHRVKQSKSDVATPLPTAAIQQKTRKSPWLIASVVILALAFVGFVVFSYFQMERLTTAIEAQGTTMSVGLGRLSEGMVSVNDRLRAMRQTDVDFASDLGKLRNEFKSEVSYHEKVLTQQSALIIRYSEMLKDEFQENLAQIAGRIESLEDMAIDRMVGPETNLNELFTPVNLPGYGVPLEYGEG